MFISDNQKREIFFRLELLEGKVDYLIRRLGNVEPQPATGKPPRKGRSWSPEQRAEAAERMKKRQAEKKAKKENA
jgi:hypothetical protein